MATFTSNSPVETEEFGRRLAMEIRPGDVIALKGDLGAGKTQFVKGLVAGLGSETVVASPTFTIIHEYPGGWLPIYHFDFFRLEDRKSAAGLGLDDYFFGTGVCVVEWADRFPDLIPEEARWINLVATGETTRTITASGAHAIRDSRIGGGEAPS